MKPIRFIADNSVQSVAKAAGIDGGISGVESCPMNVGDVICFPASPRLAFKITERMLFVGDETREAGWYLFIEPTPHPLYSD